MSWTWTVAWQLKRQLAVASSFYNFDNQIIAESMSKAKFTFRVSDHCHNVTLGQILQKLAYTCIYRIYNSWYLVFQKFWSMAHPFHLQVVFFGRSYHHFGLDEAWLDWRAWQRKRHLPGWKHGEIVAIDHRRYPAETYRSQVFFEDVSNVPMCFWKETEPLNHWSEWVGPLVEVTFVCDESSFGSNL